eukprot:SAG31_NODE_3560_length_4122_cov_6.095451_5_plen_87_part_00
MIFRWSSAGPPQNQTAKSNMSSQVGAASFTSADIAFSFLFFFLFFLFFLFFFCFPEGFPQTAVREIKLLASLRHENIIRLKEIVTP